MRLLLTLLALISGWSVSDRAVAAPAQTAAMGAMVLLSDHHGQAETQENRRSIPNLKVDKRIATVARKYRHAGAPHLPGFLPGVDRALE